MRTDSLYLGSAPAFEDTAQVGRHDYRSQATAECRAYIAQLRRQFGDEPAGCKLVVAENPHDLGTYLSVNVQYDRDDLHACEWAFRVDAEQPRYWDGPACKQLGVTGVRELENADAAAKAGEVSDGR